MGILLVAGLEMNICFLLKVFEFSNMILKIALQKYGKQWNQLKKEIPSRSVVQIRTHAQKFFIKVTKVLPPNIELIDFIQNNPLSFFANLPDDDESNPNNQISKIELGKEISSKLLIPK